MARLLGTRGAPETARGILAQREVARSTIAAELGRAAGNGHRVLEHLYERPIVSVNAVQRLLDVTYPTANQIVERRHRGLLYTSLENGDAQNVSATTIRAVADALRLDESERQHLMALVGLPRAAGRPAAPETLVFPTVDAIAFPAYLITAMWQVTACNATFRWVWGTQDNLPFNAVDRLFLDPRVGSLHGDHFDNNVKPVIAMLQASIGHYPDAQPLLELRNRIVAQPRLQEIWSAYEITSPLLPSACTIVSPAGLFTYETLTLLVSNSVALVVQVSDEGSRIRLLEAMREKRLFTFGSEPQ